MHNHIDLDLDGGGEKQAGWEGHLNKTKEERRAAGCVSQGESKKLVVLNPFMCVTIFASTPLRLLVFCFGSR
jgi:hypothetical protein